MENKPQITFDEFLAIEAKLEIKVGRIISVEPIPKSKKLLKLTVQFRYDDTETKTALTNLGDTLDPKEFLGVKMPFITNLAPVTMMGVVSEAMIMVGKPYIGGLELSDYSVGSKLL